MEHQPEITFRRAPRIASVVALMAAMFGVDYGKQRVQTHVTPNPEDFDAKPPLPSNRRLRRWFKWFPNPRPDIDVAARALATANRAANLNKPRHEQATTNVRELRKRMRREKKAMVTA